MSGDGTSQQEGQSAPAATVVFLAHAALAVWATWNLVLTTSATALRVLVGLFAAIPLFGTIVPSVALAVRGDGPLRVIGPLVLWGFGIWFWTLAPTDPPAEAAAPKPNVKPAKPAPKPKPSPKPKPKPKPRPTPTPKPKPKPRPTPTPKPKPAPEVSIEWAPEPQPRPEPPPERRPSRSSRGQDGPRGVIGEAGHEQLDAAEVAHRVRRSGGSGLGSASTCRSCGTGIDVFSGRCGCS